MASGNVEVRGLFATPVAALMLPDAEARNADLEEIILSRRTEQASIGASNIGGWHSSRDLVQWGGKRIEEVLAVARNVVTQMTSDRDGKPVRPDWVVEAWANVNAAGDSNSCHYHPGSFWSGTYYVRDGGCADDPSLGGEFDMFDPRGPTPMMHAPSLRFAGEDGRSAGSAETIRPRAGLMFIFPSFLLHAVRPYRGRDLRISVAFNFGLYAQG
ncbi:TIGR02466 family protein [Bradyrhizobium sp.]|uniref:TIGR02466 family protein n=1 Tax=Bradyrhizobium sp. TaxID=376 RepID=UPI00261E4B84|nr:TIGR02466 family protein [Bradyrhizobium sp.]